MSQTKTFTNTFNAFGASRRGSFGLAFAGAAGMLALAAGYALNVGQMSNTRSTLLNALDAAVTSTARDLTTGKIEEKDARAQVERFLLANTQNTFTANQPVRLETLVVDKRAKTVEATAAVEIDMVFPLFYSDNVQTITTESAAVYSDRKIEVAMMLDVTGSMRGQKLEDLKFAAKNAVDTFLGDQDPKNPRIRLSLVPYANSVNAGPLADAVLVETKSTGRLTRTRGLNEAPLPGEFVVSASSAGSVRPDNCATERKGGQTFTDAGPATAMVNRDLMLTTFTQSNPHNSDLKKACPDAALMPLTSDGVALKNRIENFVASGTTGGHIGTQWAWYTLSPKWASMMPAKNQPAAYNLKKTGKYAILMTDGEFNLQYAEARTVGDVFGGGAVARSMNHAKQLCENMRQAGIEIFTIGFKLDNRAARDTMQACASPDRGKLKHFFQAADREELNDAFLQIAANIERLAVIK